MNRSSTWRKAGLLALAVAFAAPAASPAFAFDRWEHHGGWGGGHAWHGGGWGGGGGCGGCGVGGALLGLGVGAAVGAAIAGSAPAYYPPPAYYAPPPAVYYGY